MRARWSFLGAAVVTVGLGLTSRLPGAPAFVLAHVGDTLYAVLIYWLVAVVRPDARSVRRASVTWGVCALIELSQAFHPPWLDTFRANGLVALVLGRGFLWSDLACYAVGVALAVGVEGVGWRVARRVAGDA